MSRRRGKKSADPGTGFAIIFVIVVVIPITLLNVALVGLGLPEESNFTVGIAIVIYLIAVVLAILIRKHYRQMQQEERSRQMEEERRKWAEQQEEERRREEQERAEQIEALLERDAFRESVHYMSGVEFEIFMANVFDKKGYHVQTTPATGDQGVDLLLIIDDRKVAVQLKRYTAPVGNKAVADVVAGMFHYKAKEAWVITTSSFTKGAVELAKSNRVRLIDGRELEDWLDDLRDEA